MVQRISFALCSGVIEIWVLVAHPDEKSFGHALKAETAFRRAVTDPPVDVHYLSMDEIDVDLLPPAKVYFRR